MSLLLIISERLARAGFPWAVFAGGAFSVLSTLLVYILLKCKAKELSTLRAITKSALWFSIMHDVEYASFYAPKAHCTQRDDVLFPIPEAFHKTIEMLLQFLKMAALSSLHLDLYWRVCSRHSPYLVRIPGRVYFWLYICVILLVSPASFAIFSTDHHDFEETYWPEVFGNGTYYAIAQKFAFESRLAQYSSIFVLTAVLSTFIIVAATYSKMTIESVHTESANCIYSSNRKEEALFCLRYIRVMFAASVLMSVALFGFKMVVAQKCCNNVLLDILHVLSTLQSVFITVPLALACYKTEFYMDMNLFEHNVNRYICCICKKNNKPAPEPERPNTIYVDPCSEETRF